MAATFTPITINEMDEFLKRAFRALKPKPWEVVRGEATRMLSLSDTVGIIVYTSVSASGTEGAGLGMDAIRIGLYNKKKNRPLKRGKMPIVKRTQNWRDNVRARIEDSMEEYDHQEGYWENLAGRLDAPREDSWRA